ncbi:MAG: hypothetical protein I8H72_00705 [Myxococcaceae bacterium]|nr:hypothetical protein [Myxococcaceae bacterium]
MCIIASYGFARPVTDSLFLEHYGAKGLPNVFLLSAAATVVAMAVYNRFNARYSLLALLGGAATLSSLLLCLGLLAFKMQIPYAVYGLYVWREVYMILLVEIFWSLADTLFNIRSARKSYGIVLGMGSLGGFAVNLMVGPISMRIGTEWALLGVLPCLGLCTILTLAFSRTLGGKPVFKKSDVKQLGAGSLSVVRNSRYLLPLLFLIAIVQISISLVDLQFNAALEIAYPEMNARTGMIGQVHAVIDVFATFLQFFSGMVIGSLGTGGVFVGIPITLGLAILSFIVSPHFLTAAILKVTSKCFDYSIFRASKEMLYIPLSHLEKTQGKALIDILIYRVAKSSAALLMIFLISIQFSDYVMHIAMSLMFAWILLAVVIVKRYKAVLSVRRSFEKN